MYIYVSIDCTNVDNQLNYVVFPRFFFFLSSFFPKETCRYCLLENHITDFFLIIENTNERLLESFYQTSNIICCFMVTLLTIEILSILATAITNLLGILTFSTDYWSITVYDFVKLRSYAKWIIIEEINNGNIYIINNTNRTQILSEINSQLSKIVFGFENNLILYKTHKGIFRQCNYLSENIRNHLEIPKCRALKTTNNQYDDLIHGMINPGREFIRKYFSHSFHLLL